MKFKFTWTHTTHFMKWLNSYRVSDIYCEKYFHWIYLFRPANCCKSHPNRFILLRVNVFIPNSRRCGPYAKSLDVAQNHFEVVTTDVTDVQKPSWQRERVDDSMPHGFLLSNDDEQYFNHVNCVCIVVVLTISAFFSFSLNLNNSPAEKTIQNQKDKQGWLYS